MGIDPGYVVKVFQGKVHLGARNIESFADLLKLAGKERDYFSELVRFGRAKSEEEIETRFERLQSIKGIKFRTVADGAVEFFRNWYNMAIRSLLSIYLFDGSNYRRLGSTLCPPISAQQARESVELLERLDLIRKGEDGRYQVTGQFISTGDRWTAPAIRDYQKKTMELAMEALERHPREMRDVSTVTMTINTKDLPLIRERVKQFRRELLLMSNENTGEDGVLQLNIQLFPVALIKGAQS